MTFSVSCQMMTTLTTFATFCALVFTTMKIHMELHAALRWKTFLTLSTWIQVVSSDCVYLFVTCQISFICKPLVTHCTQIRPWLDMMWMPIECDVNITIIFSLNSRRTFTCITQTMLSCQWHLDSWLCIKQNRHASQSHWNNNGYTTVFELAVLAVHCSFHLVIRCRTSQKINLWNFKIKFKNGNWENSK